ncbi:MAG: hypothetical protein K8R39_04670 [Arcobacteraceae bacterium]|nr:hypothetical protein [Arcobacteraceae bacterium]
MNNLIKLILLIILSFSSLLSNDNGKSKEIYLSYEKYPNRVFTGQKFDIQLSSIILKDPTSYDKIITTFTTEEGIDILTTDVVWEEIKSNRYTTTISYKVYDKEFILPRITLALIKNGQIIDYISVESPKIEYEKIAINQKLFSNIIAKNLQVHTVKTKQYTNNILHTTLHIEGINSNLEDIHFNSYEDQGINSLTQNYPNQSLYYYVMIPSHTKQINFTFYNTLQKEFITIQIPIILDEELVSTQTELNPYNSSILIYKQVFSGVFLALFIIMYIITRHNRYLILMTIMIIILAYLFIPNKKILLNENTKVYILPTSNSTVYNILDRKHIVEQINEKDKFIKVLFENENIGWIKESDVE